MNTAVLERKQIGGAESGEQNRNQNPKPTPPLSEAEQACYEIVGDLPFTKASVRAYKKQKLHEERAKMTVWKPFRYAWVTGPLESTVVIFSGLCMFFAVVSSCAILWAAIVVAGEALWGPFLLSGIAFGISVVAGLGATSVAMRLHKIKAPYWFRLPFLKYDRFVRRWFRSIPEEVYGFVCAFQRRLPGVRCEADYLTYTGDPFLVITLKKKWWHFRKRYYVFVWDEKDFVPA